MIARVAQYAAGGILSAHREGQVAPEQCVQLVKQLFFHAADLT